MALSSDHCSKRWLGYKRVNASEGDESGASDSAGNERSLTDAPDKHDLVRNTKSPLESESTVEKEKNSGLLDRIQSLFKRVDELSTVSK